MRANALRELHAAGKPSLGGWLTIPSSASAEVMAHAGFDWLCIDMQHGLIDYSSAVPMLQAISTTATVPIVRVPWNEPGIIMKSLDAGAYGVIIPMVNSRAEAEAAAGACRYAPRGYRSYGPLRANIYAGRDYFDHADDTILCICMIETAQALENLDDILSTPGVDACYVGPADLSVSLGLPPRPDHEGGPFTEALERIVAACRKHGVVPGAHAANPAIARKRIEQGFQFLEVCADADAIARTAAADLTAARGTEGAGRVSTYA
jgi:4-hydroxy-2-oxoheptanedioate aldolase